MRFEEAMPYPAASIANAFLSRAFKDKKCISPMKIQKLVYLAHGYHLAETDGNPLVDELFEAWKFGPVLPSLYHECKEYVDGCIATYISDYDNKSFEKTPAYIPTDENINDIIDFVWNTYGDWPATKLSAWTHDKDGPWSKVVSENKGFIFRNEDIDNEYIREYFNKMLPDDSEEKKST